MPFASPRVPRSLKTRRTLGALALVTAAVVGVALFAPRADAVGTVSTAVGPRAGTQLVVNGGFTKNTKGWKTNRPKIDKLTSTSGRSGKGATITPRRKGVVVLNDKKDTIASTTRGTKYRMNAWVRSSRVGTVTMIKAREVGAGKVSVHSKKLKLKNTKWHHLTLAFTTKLGKSKIDLNVLFWNTKKGQKLHVDTVSLVKVKSAPTKAAAKGADSNAKTSAGTARSGGACERPVPRGTEFGTSISTTNQSAAQALQGLDAKFGRLPIIRVFDPGMAWPWSKPRTQMIKGRDLVISFRPMPQEVLSGKYDAQFKKWFQHAPSGVTIYWSYIHEPEPLVEQGKFTAKQYREAWRRIENIADSVCRSNLYPTLILTGWTADPSSKRSWKTYYPGADVIDVMAFDPYNGASNPTAVRSYPSAADMYDAVVKVAEQAGKPYGIAETGSPRVPSDTTGSKRAAWLTSLAKYHRAHGALFVTYFESSRDGEWRLLDQPSKKAWQTAVSTSQ